MMFKSLFAFLNKDITGKTWEVEASHPFFGDMVLYAFKNSDKSYWEAEIECEGARVVVYIHAPDRSEPSDEQVQFARRIVSNPDAAFRLAEPLLGPEFERWHEKPIPADWRDALKLVGFEVPAGGNERNAWELSYESLVDPNGQSFSCSFNDGKPTSVILDA